MRLILVRHGRTPSNTGFVLDTAYPGADLDPTGQEQATDLVSRLAGRPIEAIYASDLVRTQQTAAPLAADRGLRVEILPGLREVSAGDDELSPDATRYIQSLIAWGEGHLEAKVPGGEDAIEFFDRYNAAIAGIVAAGHNDAVVVSHGAALRVWAMAQVKGFDTAIGKTHLDNTAIVVIDGNPADGWSLVELEGIRPGALME